MESNGICWNLLHHSMSCWSRLECLSSASGDTNADALNKAQKPKKAKVSVPGGDQEVQYCHMDLALHHTSHHHSMIMAVLLHLKHTPQPPQHLTYHHLDIHLLANAIQHFTIHHIAILLLWLCSYVSHILLNHPST